MKPQSWGCITQKGDTLFVHVLDSKTTNITLESFPYKKISKAYKMSDNSNVAATLKAGIVSFPVTLNQSENDDVIVLLAKE